MRVPSRHSIAPPASPPGRLTHRETVSVLGQQRFDFAAQIRIGACEQSIPLRIGAFPRRDTTPQSAAIVPIRQPSPVRISTRR
jgi:hypothetical protein